MERKAAERAGLIAAYRDGLGLCGLAAISGPEGVRFAAVGAGGVAAIMPGEEASVRFWCRRMVDAEDVVAAITVKRRRQSGATDPALMTAAGRLHVVLYSNVEVTSDATAAITRMEEEFATLQRAGALKSVNRSYRIYRQDAAARSEKIVPYVQWLNKYKQNLVRQLAAALRNS